MSRIEELAEELLADPKPILFLDTCDILNSMQGLAEWNAGRLEWSTRLLSALATSPGCVQPVVARLVVHEWGQNLPQIERQVDQALRTLDNNIKQIYEALESLGKEPKNLPSAAFSFAEASIGSFLVERMRTVIDKSACLDEDESCVERALSRVMARRRPSHDGHIKDSIILEHYLALVSLLRVGHFTDRCVFVSSNTKDYAAGARSSVLNPELKPEFASLGLEYFSNPVEALARLEL